MAPETINQQSEGRETLRYAKTLSDILHIHRWAGGDLVDLATIYGLANGVESVVEESVPRGISRETQEKIEDVLQDVDAGKQSPKSLDMKSRFRSDRICETDASIIMRLCVLQGRFTDVIKKIAESNGSVFNTVFGERTETSNWDGAKIYMELVVDLGEKKPRMIATFAPCIPRIGETIDLRDLFEEKETGSMWMEVVGIEYSAHRMEDPLDKNPMAKLIPYIILEPCKPKTK
jgi:hypothetical protein